MPLRFVVPLPGPFAYIPRSRAERALEQATGSQISPARAAEIRHEARHGVRWVLFACASVPALAFTGAGALWFLLPCAALLALAQVMAHHSEATADSRQQAIDGVRAGAPAAAPVDIKAGRARIVEAGHAAYTREYDARHAAGDSADRATVTAETARKAAEAAVMHELLDRH